jgi:sialic acid synthase SpsE
VAGTGVLSRLGSYFETLTYNGSTHDLNAAFGSAFGATMLGESSTQVLFREAAAFAPAFALNLSDVNLSKTYGNADPDVLAGLSDHTMGTTASVTSIALGACLIEKHFTLSRADKGPDSEFSIESADLVRLATETKEAWQALGNAGFERQSAEAGSKVFRRSLYFVRDLSAGHLITSEDIRRIRPGMGLAPKYLEQVLGKRLSRDVPRGAALSWDVIE